MQKRILTLILVVIIGILAGVGIVRKQAREPLLRELLKGQDIILQAQRRLEAKLGSSEGATGSPALQDTAIAQRLQDAENRLSVLEANWKGLQGNLNQINANAGAARQAPPAEDLSKVHTIPVVHSPVRGNKKASVTIVEFVDFQCPFCARFHPPISEVLKAYPNDVNYILKNFPLSFHQQARIAAKAAFAAGEQGKYWEMADALLENGKALSEEKFKETAGNLGLNVEKFMDDYKNKDAQWEKWIQEDMDLAQTVDVRGTPTFYINGQKTNARDFSSFKSEIDKILNK
jgi:protein-disulfide isomerase